MSDPIASTPGDSEACDLPVELRAQIDSLFQKLGRNTHYQLLGLAQDADRGQVKRAYYRLSKDFHPDRYYRKELGPYKIRLEQIFSAMTEAYRILSDEESRQRYDELVQARSPVEDDFDFVESEGGSVEAEPAQPTTNRAREQRKQRKGPPAPGKGPSRASADIAFMPGSLRDRRRQRKAKAKPPPLFAQRLQSKLATRIRRAKRSMDAGRKAMAEKRWREAATHFQMVMTSDPRNQEAPVLQKRCQREYRNIQAEEHYKQAIQQVQLENYRDAARHFQECIECKPTLGKYYNAFGKMIREQTLQTRTALELLRKAVEFEPRKVVYLKDLAEAYEDVGMPSNAIKVHERVLQIDKNDRDSQKALKRLR